MFVPQRVDVVIDRIGNGEDAGIIRRAKQKFHRPPETFGRDGTGIHLVEVQ